MDGRTDFGWTGRQADTAAHLGPVEDAKGGALVAVVARHEVHSTHKLVRGKDVKHAVRRRQDVRRAVDAVGAEGNQVTLPPGVGDQ
jgi:hypothetical protein